MRTPGLIQTPFAFSGDKTTIPTATQPDGSVSMATGWGRDYQRDQATDPQAKPIDRATTNWLMFAITQLLQRWQTESVPEMILSSDNGGAAYSYMLGAMVSAVTTDNVRHVYISTVNNNTATPPTNPSVPFANNWYELASAIKGAINGNYTAGQTIQGALTVVGALTINSALITDTPSTRAIDSNYVTRGRAVVMPVSADVGAQGVMAMPSFIGATAGVRSTRMWGVVQGPASGENWSRKWRVNFPVAFKYPPTVMVTPANYTSRDNGGHLPIVGVTAVDARGFTCIAHQSVISINMQIAPIVNWSADGATDFV